MTTKTEATLNPTSIGELADAVRSAPRIVATGAGTKPRLVPTSGAFTRLSTSQLRGIVEYDSSEFTFTALAGTPVRDIVAALGEKGQNLPFDPWLVEAGATLGGTVAAGLSGPGRFRFGGLRDFILGVRFVDGTGRLLRMGGKVVKNAAGFDLQLSGHTHSVQYFPFTLLIGLFHRYAAGLNRHKDMWIYVNRGTAYWGPPLRTANAPEITLLTLTRA